MTSFRDLERLLGVHMQTIQTDLHALYAADIVRRHGYRNSKARELPVKYGTYRPAQPAGRTVVVDTTVRFGGRDLLVRYRVPIEEATEEADAHHLVRVDDPGAARRREDGDPPVVEDEAC